MRWDLTVRHVGDSKLWENVQIFFFKDSITWLCKSCNQTASEPTWPCFEHTGFKNHSLFLCEQLAKLHFCPCTLFCCPPPPTSYSPQPALYSPWQPPSHFGRDLLKYAFEVKMGKYEPVFERLFIISMSFRIRHVFSQIVPVKLQQLTLQPYWFCERLLLFQWKLQLKKNLNWIIKKWVLK